MADSSNDFFIKDYNKFYQNIPNPPPSSCTDETSINANCVYHVLNINKQKIDKIQNELSKASAGNENHENTKNKYYNQYMIFFNMGVGTIGLIYYIYFFMKNKK
jgi:hypothetical protein